MSSFRRFWVEEYRHSEAFSEKTSWVAFIVARVALLNMAAPQPPNPPSNTRVLPGVKATLFDRSGSLRGYFYSDSKPPTRARVAAYYYILVSE